MTTYTNPRMYAIIEKTPMSYKKIGGIHFVRVGRFGFNFYLSRSKAQRVEAAVIRAFERVELCGVRSRVIGGQRVFSL